jgi:hypothetical protein
VFLSARDCSRDATNFSPSLKAYFLSVVPRFIVFIFDKEVIESSSQTDQKGGVMIHI